MAASSTCFDIEGNPTDCANGDATNAFGTPVAGTIGANNTPVNADWSNWFPDTSSIDLPGQLPGIPGGGVSNGGVHAADPMGINTVSLNPTVTPTPTGGYLSVLATMVGAAGNGFSTYVKGSPSVAVPAPKRPGTTITGGALMGTTNWLMIGGVVVAGVLILGYLAIK